MFAEAAIHDKLNILSNEHFASLKLRSMPANREVETSVDGPPAVMTE